MEFYGLKGKQYTKAGSKRKKLFVRQALAQKWLQQADWCQPKRLAT